MIDYALPILVIVVLIVLNALFVAAEFAIVAVRRPRIEGLAEEGHATAQRLQRILSTPQRQDRYIAIAQLGITLASIGLGMYGESSVAGWLYGPLEHWGGLGVAAAHTIGTIVAVTLLTYLHVVFGEMIPKALALGSPEATAFRVWRPMQLMGTLFRPVVWLLDSIGTLILKLLRVPDPPAGGRVLSPKELELIVSESFEGGALAGEQQEFITNIFDFGERRVHQLMTPRPRVVGLGRSAPREELLQRVLEAKHSRLPVFEGDLDHIVGILHVKDLIRQHTKHPEGFDLDALLRRAPRVPEGLPAETLLAAFKRLKVHMAVVMDEFGGTAGIITLEDLVEEVVGEVEDEFDEEGRAVRVLDDGVLLVRGDVLLDELHEHYDLHLYSDTDETVAGLLVTRLGRAPETGDRVELDEAVLSAERVEGLAVTCVRVELSNEAWERFGERSGSFEPQA